MSEKINIIRKIVEESSVEDSKKKTWVLALNHLDKIKFPDEFNINLALDALYQDMQENINALDIFLSEIGSFVSAYVKGGDQALGENIDRSVEILDKKLESLE